VHPHRSCPDATLRADAVIYRFSTLSASTQKCHLKWVVDIVQQVTPKNKTTQNIQNMSYIAKL